MITNSRPVFHRPLQFVPVTLLTLAALCLADRAGGQTTYDWNTGSGLFGLASNWTPPTGGPPGAVDTARFNVDNPGYILTFGQSHASADLLVRDGDVTFRPQSINLDMVQYATAFTSIGGGNLTIRNFIGNFELTSQSINVGDAGVGSFTILDGADASCVSGSIAFDGSTGEATVDGVGSTWIMSSSLSVGEFGNGTLNITGGGRVENQFGAVGVFIGFDTVGTGHATVDGDGSMWINSEALSVGLAGNGTLNITGGGRVENTNGNVGSLANATGQVTVEGAGSTWSNSVELNVGGSELGNGGAGTLTIGPGGTVEVAGDTTIYEDGVVSLQGGTLATGTLIDAGSTFNWESGTLNITGSQGVTIGSGAFLFANSTVTLGPNQSLGVTHELTVPNTTTLFLTGGNLNTGSAQIESGGQMFLSGGDHDFGAGLVNHGSLVLSNTTVDGPVTSPGGSDITVLGVATFNDLVSGAGGIFGPGTAVFLGGHDPGDSVATVPIESNVVYGGTNTLFIELDGSELGEFDRLEIGGSIYLGGTLEVLADPAVDLEFGDTMVFINALGGVFNAFDSLVFPTLDEGKALRLAYGETIVALEVVLAGDYNGDGTVGAADYTVWRDTLGQTGFGLAADGTGPSGGPDGVVDELDYQFWVDNFGNASPGGGSISHLAPGDSPGANYAVPEPTALVLALLCLLRFTTSRALRRRETP